MPLFGGFGFGGLMPHKVYSTEYEGDDRRGGERRNGNGWRNGNGDLPWWVRSIAVIGLPGAIAIFLVWVGSQEIPKIKVQQADMQSIVLSNQREIQDLKKQQSSMIRMLQRICSNTARNEFDRQRCFDE